MDAVEWICEKRMLCKNTCHTKYDDVITSIPVKQLLELFFINIAETFKIGACIRKYASCSVAKHLMLLFIASFLLNVVVLSQPVLADNSYETIPLSGSQVYNNSNSLNFGCNSQHDQSTITSSGIMRIMLPLAIPIIPNPLDNIKTSDLGPASTFSQIYTGTSVNTRQSIYCPEESAEIVIVLLNSKGAPVSNAEIHMDVTAPGSSTVHFSTTVGSIVESLDPGVYEAEYITGAEGQYNISCTAMIESAESHFDTYFMVQSTYDFDIIRRAQSKIDPKQYDRFDVTVDIISYTDADTITVWEYVPADFEVYTDASVVEADNLKVLTWQRSLIDNRTSVNYSYSVPMEWPKLYQLGPLEIDYGNETFTEARPWWVAVDPDEAHLILFWDGGVAPSGWTCISDNDGEDFYQRFPRGAAAYGGFGGSDSHTHTVTQDSVSSGPYGTDSTKRGSQIGMASSTHTHPAGDLGSTASASSLPTYRTLKIIRYDAGVPSTIPAGAIAMFNTTPPSGWTPYTDHDGYFVRGDAAAGTTYTNADGHTHSFSVELIDSTAGIAFGSSGTGFAATTHDHTLPVNTDSQNEWPLYIEVVLAKADSETSIPEGMLGMFNETPSVTQWDVKSDSGNDFYQRYLFANTSTSFPTIGGQATHQHASQTGISSDGANQEVAYGSSSSSGTGATADHYHTVDISFSEVDNLPPYIDVIFAYYVAEPTPDTTLPEWQNQGENTTTPAAGDSVLLYAQGRDETALDWATLSTNESGAWVNYTDGTHSSPIDMGDAEDTWVPSNFTWQNSSVTEGTTVGWKIWYNDTSGNWNCTDVRTLIVQAATPSATSRWNNKTNNDLLTLSINVSEEIEFGIVYDQTGNITWNATGYTNRSNLTVLSGNQTYNWSTSGTKYLNASMNNTNGTSSITRWCIVVQSIPDAPSITNVASSAPTRSKVHITWDTNQSDSDNRVKYSLNPDLSGHNWSSWDNNTDSVHIQLTGLSPSTKYYYSAYSYNGTNVSLYSNSSIYNFTTSSNANAHGNVKDKDGILLDCIITVYDEDGTTELNSTTGSSFNWDDVPVGGYMQFDALSTKNVSARFKISGDSSNCLIIIDNYGSSNPESNLPQGNVLKYVDVSASNLSYSSIEISIRYTSAELGSLDENLLAISHFKNNTWNELSTSVDAVNNLVTATATSLSSFAVIEATTTYNATLYVYDTKGNADPADDKLVHTASLSDLPANGTTFDLGFIGDIYKNHTYVVEMQIRTNYTYEFDADYRKETFFRANNSFSLTDTSRQEYLVNTTLVTDDGERTEDIFVSQIHQVDYSDDYKVGECGVVRGDLDVVSGSGDTIVRWHNNTAGDGSSWGTSTVYDDTNLIRSVAVGDIDGDGDLDVVSGNYDGDDIRLHRNNGDGTWTTTDVYLNIGDTLYALTLGDIDGDGDLDVIAGKGPSGGYKVGWYNNTGDFASTWPRIEVANLNYAHYTVAVGDIDGDGDIDIIAGNSGNDVYWYNNTAGNGSDWTGEPINTAMPNEVRSIAVGDIDGDGDLDVVSGITSASGNDLFWHNNTAGDGSSWQTTGVDDIGTVYTVAVGDVDNDGDLDIFSGDSANNINLYKNNGDATFSTPVLIASMPNEVRSVAVGDIDSDGDLDVVSGLASATGNDVFWYNNTAGNGSNWQTIGIIDVGNAVYSVAVGDLDNDANSNILDYYYNSTEGAEFGVDEFPGWDDLTENEDYSFYFIAAVDDDWSDGTNDTITFYCGNEAGSGWALTEPKMYGAVRTPIKVNWTWNITTAPPVTLAVNISQAPADVTRGEVFSSLNASVNNTGTVNATNTWLNWTLPSGWSNQTGNLDQSLGILEPDEVGWNNLTVNVSQSAALGPQTVTSGADCDEDACGSNSKSITVYAPTNVSQVTSNKTNPVQGDIFLLSARLLWDNGTAIYGQNISFYNGSIYIGSDFTNSTGWAQVSWNTTGVGLQEIINATYNGNATIYSRASYNNSLTIIFPDITMTVYTNRSEYRPPAGVLINGNVTNITGGGPSAGATVNISLLYPNGTQAYYNQTTTDSCGGYNTTYNLAASDPIGTYTVNTNATSATGNFTTNSTTFLVVGLVASVTTDKSAYLAGENVTITVYAEYNNGTEANNSLVNLTIKDPGDAIINETSGYIDPDGVFVYLYTLPAEAAEGTYSVTAKVTDPENYVEYAYTSFDVARKAATLNVEPSITVMWQNQSNIFYLQVTNTGAENINGSVNLTTTDPLYFNITNITAKEFTNLTPGSQFTAEFNVTVNMTTPLAMYELNATLAYDNDTKLSQKDVYVKVIKEPELFVRTVTDKAVYLLDPYQWVYIASDLYWPPAYEGRPTVTINAMIVDQYGRLMPNERYPDELTVTYYAHNGTDGAPIISSGNMDNPRTGFYTKTIEVNETTGVADYLVHINVTGLGKEVSGSTTFTVDRWDCDSCHRPYGGKHGWNDVIGSFTYTEGSVTYLNLVNFELTHTPDHGTDNHENVFYKKSSGCVGCHSGYNTIECTNCHTTNYLQGEHDKVTTTGVSAPITNCANASCHGHIDVGDKSGDLDNRYPSCDAVNCHPISYKDNFTISSINDDLATVPQWLNNTTGARDLAIHPNPDNPIVNCSFCHNNFHNIFAGANTLTCDDCHNESIGYTLHNGTTPASTAANCTDCHNFSGTNQIDIHNIVTPTCSQCHDEVNHSSYDTDGVSCLQCHNDNTLNYSGNVLINGTYLASTSIHSMDYLIPECDDCHIGYNNHSSYDTYGVDCIYCHNNKTLTYTDYLLVNDKGVYNTNYNTNTAIHAPNAIDMIPNCTDCHGSSEYSTHLGNDTEVTAGTAANCTQCHDNVVLNYTGSVFPAGLYNTNADIHSTSRTDMLPNQTADLNDSCSICHVTVYGETTRTHSNLIACYNCHFDPDVWYQNSVTDRPMEHTINETIGCRECHFDFSRLDDMGKPTSWVNYTMYNESVHGDQSKIDCVSCHTKYHLPPESGWKACECCHSYQLDPKEDTNRHNLTSTPSNSVVDNTNCTDCHYATLYNTASTTFSSTANNDCRYCHTYPDKNREYFY